MRSNLQRVGVLVASMSIPGWTMADVINGADTAWIMSSTALVLFMTLPGLALFYGGLVRSRNVLSILMQCFSISALATLVWLICGYSLAFTDGGVVNGFIGGLGKVLFAGVSEDAVVGTIPESSFALFQMTFAIITPALVIGGFAERIKFSAVLLFSLFWLLLVYIPITHWVWGGGWLAQLGLLDFAGGTVVHITAGVAALVAALVVGPRSGFGKTPMPPHNMTLTVTGAGMLWVGWFGFNGGSALASNGDAAMAMLVTHISAATGAFSWMIIEWRKFGHPTALGAVTGLIAGLGTITPASGYVGPGGALIIGLLAGTICFNATMLLKNRLKIDDSLDVFPVHGIGGVVGTLLAALFAAPTLGIFAGQGFADGVDSIAQQLGIQFVGVIATLVYTTIVTYIIFNLVAILTSGLRVTQDQEAQGLDIVDHEERGYDI